MKTLFKSLLLFAAVVISMISCARQELVEDVKSSDMITLKFNINNSDNAEIGKALLGTQNGKNFLEWEDGDKIGTFSVGSFVNGQTTSTESKNNGGTVSVSGGEYVLNVQTFNAGSVTNIYSYFPFSAAAGKNKESAIITIPASQTVTSDGFDADAMPMAGEPVEVDLTTVANTDTPCGEIRFCNLGSIINFKVYSSTTTDETITSVKYVTSGSIGGAFSLDLTEVNPEDEETLALTESDPVSEVTTYYTTHPTIGTGKTNAIDVYMVVAPGTYANTQVIVTTNAHTYTLNASGEKTYTRSHVKPMYVNIQNGTQGDLPAEETWTKVTSASQFTAGTYYILRADDAYYVPNSTGNPSCVSFIAGNEIPDAMKWTATVSGSGLIFESYTHPGYYLWTTNTGNANTISVAENSTGANASKVWNFAAVEANSTTYYTATAGANKYLVSYGDTNWRYYASTNINSTNIPAEFYKLDDNTPSFSVESPLNVSVNEDTYNVSIVRSNFTGAITVNVPNDCNWIIADNVAANANSFAIMVSENTGVARSATLTLTGSGVTTQSLEVNQDGARTLPFEETFYDDKGSFTIDDVNLGEISYVWSHDNSYHYMKASSYVSSTNHEAESWLISPAIVMPSLSSGESIKLKFSQIISKFFGTVADEASLMIKGSGGSWSKAVISYPEVTSGNFSSWDDQTVDLSSYAGETIQFAFKYIGTTSACGTWEIKNVSVKKYEPVVLSSISVSGQTTSFIQGDTFSFGGTVTATYSDDSTADVTDFATFSGYNMSTTGTQTVTVTYVEGGVTKTTSYDITVSAPISTVGDPWYYTFAENPFSENSANLTYSGISLTWSTSIAPSYQNNALSFGSNTNPAAAALSTSSYVNGISKISISIKANSSKSVSASVSVGGVAFKCNDNATITHSGNVLETYEFIADNIVAGQIVISFSGATGGYQIKTIRINPGTITLSSIAATGQMTSFTVGDTFVFGGSVIATYIDNTTSDVTASSTFSGYNMSTAGNQTVTVTYIEGGITKTTTYEITVSEASVAPPDPETISISVAGTNNGSHSTITIAKGSGSNNPAYIASDGGVRCYPGNTITINAGSNTIAGLSISYKANKNNKNVYPTGVSANSGSFSTGYSTSGSTMVWSGSTSSVVLTVQGTAGNVAFKSITITYE